MNSVHCRLVFLGALGLAGCAASHRFPAGVYGTSAQFRAQRPALAALDVFPTLSERGLVVVEKTPDAAFKLRVPLDRVWGYADARGRGWRVAGGQAYFIEQADSLMLYSRWVGGRRQVSARYYFSAGLDGPVRPLERAELAQAFAARNPDFVAALQRLKWYQSLTGRDAAARTYRVAALFRQSLVPAVPQQRP